MRCTISINGGLVVWVLVHLACVATAAGAEVDDPFVGVEEIRVYGVQTEARFGMDSASTVAFDAEDLEAYRIEDVTDIGAYVPNVEIRVPDPTSASFFVRGVGLQDFSANASSAVPIFQDGIPRDPAAAQLAGFFDVARVDVQKGPKGSGNHRNASAGVIHLSTRRPEPELGGFMRFSTSRLVSVDARDANRYEAETAINVPVWRDLASVRLSARYVHENPFFENGCANRIPFADREIAVNSELSPRVDLCGEGVYRGEVSRVAEFLPRFIGEVDDFGFRGQIRIHPPDSGVDWLLRVELTRLARDSPVGQHIGTARGIGGPDHSPYQDPDNASRQAEILPGVMAANPDVTRRRDLTRLTLALLGEELLERPLDQHPYRGDFDLPGRTFLDTRFVSTTGRIELEDVDLEINAGFLDYRRSQSVDFDLSPNDARSGRSNDQGWELYGDFAISGTQLGNLAIEWETGFYSLTEVIESSQAVVIGVNRGSGPWQQETFSWGAFALARRELGSVLSIAAGARYNWERKDFGVQGDYLLHYENQRTWDAFTGFVEVRFDFTADVASYVKYTRGFKAGHFNPGRARDVKVPGEGFADPEQIDAFEWGWEFAFLGDKVSGTSAVFYYVYDDYQVFRYTRNAAGLFRSLENADKATSYGAEMELSVRPLEGLVPVAVEGLSIGLRGGFLEANFVEFTGTEGRFFGGGTIGVSVDFSGESLINAPKFQFAATLDWPLDLGSLGTLTPRYDVTWTDDTPFDANRGRGELDAFGESRLPSYLIGNRAYFLHNLRLEWEPSGRSGIKISGWCRNVTDERYKTFVVDLSTFASRILNRVADPRMCGFETRMSW